jgi:hypothetical protein
VSHTVGDLVTRELTVRDEDGDLVNTPTVTVAVIKPDGTAVSPAPTVTNTGSGGLYTYPVTVTAAGEWNETWTLTGTVVGTEFGQYTVRAARQLAVSLQEFKTHMRFSPTGTVDDAKLLDCLVAVTDLMEAVVGPVTPREFTEWHTVRGCVISPRHHPLVSVTSITPFQGTALDASTFVVDTDLNLIRLPNTYTATLMQVVLEAGHDPWPGGLKYAGKIIGQHDWSVNNGNGGRPSPDADVLAMIPGTGYLVPYRALELMRPSLRVMAA